MNIIYVQSYPVYHDMPYDEPFLDLVNRDKWMPALTCQKGHPAELWAVGDDPGRFEWQYDTLPALPVRVFPVDREEGESEDHTSVALNKAALKAWKNRGNTAGDSALHTTIMPRKTDNEGEASRSSSTSGKKPVTGPGSTSGSGSTTGSAKQGSGVRDITVRGSEKSSETVTTQTTPPVPSAATHEAVANGHSAADLFVLNEAGGGVGSYLARKVLIPNRIPYAVILRGGTYDPVMKHASVILYETEWQYRKLTRRSWKIWQPVFDDQKLIRLPKSVDIRHFAPDPKKKKEFDLIVMGKIIDGHKDFQTIFELSRRRKIGVVGGGPMQDSLKSKYPEITWFGAVPYSEVPSYLNRGKLYFHSGRKEHFPRAIVEAAACGVPPVAFGDVIHEDIIPDGVGLRVSANHYASEIDALLEHPERLKQLSQSARKHAETHWHHCSSKGALTEMVKRVRNK